MSLKLAALATVAIPGLDVVATRPPQYASSDYRYGGVLDSHGRHLVVQEPLHGDADRALRTERGFLESLDGLSRKDALPFDVIDVIGSTENEREFEAVVYEHLSGNELDLDELRPGPGVTRAVGRAIAAIHELPFSVVLNCGLPMQEPEACRANRLDEVDEAARTGKIPTILLARWETALDDVSRWKFAPTVVHGDLAPESVLTGNGQVISVLNWSNAHIGDPAIDLAWLYTSAPEESLDTIEEAYSIGRHERPDPHLIDRALLYSELAVLRWFLHGVRIGSDEIIDDAQKMLTDLARHVEHATPRSPEEPDQPSGWDISGSIAADPVAETAPMSAPSPSEPLPSPAESLPSPAMNRSPSAPSAASPSSDSADASPESPEGPEGASERPVFG